MSDTRNPWHKLPDEPVHWFARFKVWLKQQKPRSVLALYKAERVRKGETKKLFTFPPSWADAKNKYRWQERAEAWDAAEQERKDREWAAQREAERRTELALAEVLRQKALAMLALPEVAEVIKYNHKGEEVERYFVPESRAFKAAADMLGEAKAHARHALEMDKKREGEEQPAQQDLYLTLIQHIRQQPIERDGRSSPWPGLTVPDSTND